MSGYCKYYKQKKQVSYDNGLTWSDTGEYQRGSLYESDSTDCGYVGVLYRWVNLNPSIDYYCSGASKYYKQQRQVSFDGGNSWSNVSPAEYQMGSLYEINSVDCGYIEHDYSNDYLTFVAVDGGTFSFNQTGNGTLQYSTDGGSTWRTLTSTNNRYNTTVSVSAGNKIIWKGNLSTVSGGNDGVGKFSSTGKYTVEGNALSLLYGDNFRGQTSLGYSNVFEELFYNNKVTSAEHLALPSSSLTSSCYSGMFYKCELLAKAPVLSATTLSRQCYLGMFELCKSLTVAPTLPATTMAIECYYGMFSYCTNLTAMPSLPATTLANGCYYKMFNECSSLTGVTSLSATTLASECYYGMFWGCTSLTTVPSNMLPATTLASYCYYGMFWGCISLTTAPVLSATTLANYCYASMFLGCESLTTSPDLPATVLAPWCYNNMFEYCTSLTNVKCLATDISASGCTYTWLYGVASTGTFTKNSSMSDWTRGQSGIPSNWTIQNA